MMRSTVLWIVHLLLSVVTVRVSMSAWCGRSSSTLGYSLANQNDSLNSRAYFIAVDTAMRVSGCGGVLVKARFTHTGGCTLRFTLWQRDSKNPKKFKLVDKTDLFSPSTGGSVSFAKKDYRASDKVLQVSVDDKNLFLGYSLVRSSSCKIRCSKRPGATTRNTVFYAEKKTAKDADIGLNKFYTFSSMTTAWPAVQVIMQDINECTEKTDNCSTTQPSKCVNTDGRYRCDCARGFVHQSDHWSKCVLQNECLANPNRCSLGQTCRNTFDSQVCCTGECNGLSCVSNPLGHPLQALTSTLPGPRGKRQYVTLDTSLRINGCQARVSSVSFYAIGKCKITFTAWQKGSSNSYTLKYKTNEYTSGRVGSLLSLRTITIRLSDSQILTQSADDVYLGYSVNNAAPTGGSSSSSSSGDSIDDGLCRVSTKSGSSRVLWIYTSPTQTINSKLKFSTSLKLSPSISFTVEDIGTCSNIGVSPNCTSDQQCINTIHGFRCACKQPGYGHQSSQPWKPCVDINECKLAKTPCPNGTVCKNTAGSYRCDCPTGFKPNVTASSAMRCVDIDECSFSDACPENSTCLNVAGSYHCRCHHGHTNTSANKTLQCIDIDECSSNTSSATCPTNSDCRNVHGSYHCVCRSGFDVRLSPWQCIDIDECSPEKSSSACPANSSCNNTDGGYDCICENGFKMQASSESCIDVDECITGHNCSSTERCENNVGGFSCEEKPTAEDILFKSDDDDSIALQHGESSPHSVTATFTTVVLENKTSSDMSLIPFIAGGAGAALLILLIVVVVVYKYRRGENDKYDASAIGVSNHVHFNRSADAVDLNKCSYHRNQESGCTYEDNEHMPPVYMYADIGTDSMPKVQQGYMSPGDDGIPYVAYPHQRYVITDEDGGPYTQSPVRAGSQGYNLPLRASPAGYHAYDELLRATPPTNDIYATALPIIDENSIYTEPPHEIKKLYQHLQKSKYQKISRERIKLGRHLGKGEFGIVMEGVWTARGETLPVAIKVLQGNCTEEARRSLLSEAAIMGQFRHSNVVRLCGVVTDGDPTYVVLELMQRGDLRGFLIRQSPDPGQVVDDNVPELLLRMSTDIARGMDYLAGKSFVHRDLAARNVLLDSHLTCKIGDFGMSRNLDDDQYYVSRGGKIPIRWTAPEALLYKKYSQASDVWSYGVVLFEVFTLGKKPFFGMKPQDVMALVTRENYRLPPPPGCPRKIYQLMINCWHPDSHCRPTFSHVMDCLKETDILNISPGDLPEGSAIGRPLMTSNMQYLQLQKTYQS